MNEFTRILSVASQGDTLAAGMLLPLVYDELRKLAAQKLAMEKPGHTLQPTALVHEAFLRLVGDKHEALHWEGRAHFFAAAAEAMRRILVESARRKQRVKHGGELQRVVLKEDDLPVRPPPEEILAVDEALDQLAEADPEAAKVVHLHFFAGLSIEQVADSLKMSRATAYRQWSFARAWLRVAIGNESGVPAW